MSDTIYVHTGDDWCSELIVDLKTPSGLIEITQVEDGETDGGPWGHAESLIISTEQAAALRDWLNENAAHAAYRKAREKGDGQ